MFFESFSLSSHKFSWHIIIFLFSWGSSHALGIYIFSAWLHDLHLFKIFPRHSCPQRHYTIFTSLKYFHAIRAHKSTTRSSPLYIFIFKVDQIHTKPIGKSKSKLREHVPHQKNKTYKHEQGHYQVSSLSISNSV